MIPLSNRRIIQNAYVVNDLEAAMRHWTQTLGVGPFFVLDTSGGAPGRYLYRGRNLIPEIRVALGQAGDVQIEFMQLMDDTPSVYTDMYPRGTEGFHHVCVMAEDLDADVARLEKSGCERVVDMAFGDFRLYFLDARAQIGSMLEVVRRCAFIDHLYGRVREAARDWDGVTDPVRAFV